MKTHLLAISLISWIILTRTGSAQSVYPGIPFDGFETYTIGALNGQGGWLGRDINGTSIINVSNVQAYSGVKSVYIFDGDTTNRPKAQYDYGGDATYGQFNFAVKEDPSTGVRDNWRVDFFVTGSSATHFSIVISSTSLSLIGGSAASTTLSTVNLSSTTYNFANWNTFSLVFNNTLHTASVYINGGSTPILTQGTDTSTNWTLGRIQLSVGSGGATGQGVYYDAYNQWNVTNKLEYVPPTLVAPTKAPLATSGFFNGTYASDEDVVVQLPTTGPRTGGTIVNGGRNVQIIGGDLGHVGLIIRGPSESAYMEGLKMDMASALTLTNGVYLDNQQQYEHDGIDTSGVVSGTANPPDFYLQNTYIAGPHGLSNGTGTVIPMTSITCKAVSGTTETVEIVTSSTPTPPLNVNDPIVCAGATLTEFNDTYTIKTINSPTDVTATRTATWLPFVHTPTLNDTATGGRLWPFGTTKYHSDCYQCIDDSIQNMVYFYKNTLVSSYQCFIGGHGLSDTEARGLNMTRVNMRTNNVWPQSYSSDALYVGDTDANGTAIRLGQFPIALDRVYITPRSNNALLDAVVPSGTGVHNTRCSGAVAPVAAQSPDGGQTIFWPTATVSPVNNSNLQPVYGMTVNGVVALTTDGHSGETGYVGKDYADPNSGQSDAPGAGYVSPGYSSESISPLVFNTSPNGILLTSSIGTVAVDQQLKTVTLTLSAGSVASSGVTVARTDVDFSGEGYIINLSLTSSGGLFVLDTNADGSKKRNILTTQQISAGTYNVTVQAMENGNTSNTISQLIKIVVQ